MTPILNRFLKLADLELRSRRRTIPSLMSHPRLATAGKIIEFIGPQGIGKSTLNNDLYKSLKDNWFFRADLGEVGPAASSLCEIEQLHRDIYFRKIRYLKKKQADPWKSITTSRQMSKVIGESLTILSNDFPRGFMLDESLFKNFPREILKLADAPSRPLWRNRAFIYLRAQDPDFAVARYQGRVTKRGSRGMLQRPPSDAEVHTLVTRDTALFDKIVGKAQGFGCPVIALNAEDDHQDNITRILDFERQLRLEGWPDPIHG